MLIALINILGGLISLIKFAVIAQFILSLLIAYNVVNTYNQFVSALDRALNAILDPILRPIRKIMPDTRPLDLSPIVLLFGLWALQELAIGFGRWMGVIA